MTNRQIRNKFFSAYRKAVRNYPRLSRKIKLNFTNFKGINDKLFVKFPVRFTSINQFQYLVRETRSYPARIEYYNVSGTFSISKRQIYYVWVYYSPGFGTIWGLYPITTDGISGYNEREYSPWDWDWHFLY